MQDFFDRFFPTGRRTLRRSAERSLVLALSLISAARVDQQPRCGAGRPRFRVQLDGDPNKYTREGHRS